jgi:hypothetical protein
MKKFIAILTGLLSFVFCNAQISGKPAVAPNSQPVPNATATEKSAAPQQSAITVPSKPVAPVYPGGTPEPVVMPRETVYPAASPSPTQPVQKEPLSPIESTNTLQPQRPQRDQNSRENNINGHPTSVIPDNRTDKNKLRAASSVEPNTVVASPVLYPGTSGNSSAQPKKKYKKTTYKRKVKK